MLLGPPFPAQDKVRVAVLGMLPQLALLLQQLGHEHRLLDLLCQLMRALRFFDSAPQTDLEQEELALFVSLNKQKRALGTIIYPPLRARRQSAGRPTIADLLAVCLEYLRSATRSPQEKLRLAGTLDSLLDVVNCCTWTMRDSIFE